MTASLQALWRQSFPGSI